MTVYFYVVAFKDGTLERFQDERRRWWLKETSDFLEQITGQLRDKIDGNQRRGWASNIVLHDGGHQQMGANRGPSVTAAGQLLKRYAGTHRFVRVDAWSGGSGELVL